MKKLIYLTFPLVLLLIIACSDDGDDMRLYDDYVVSTQYDTAADFSSYATYYIAKDTIGYLSNSSRDTIFVYGSNSTYPRSVIEEVRKQMNDAGYSFVEKSQNPDLGVKITVAENLNFYQQVIYPSYYYSGYYGYGGGYNYPYVQTYSNRSATLIIELLDLKNATPSKVKAIWMSYMGDLYATWELDEAAERGIRQAFVQSPYLKKP
jgi:hypothetical protein